MQSEEQRDELLGPRAPGSSPAPHPPTSTLGAAAHTRSASLSALCLRCSSCSFSSYWLYSFLVISLITSALASWDDSTCNKTCGTTVYHAFRVIGATVPTGVGFSKGRSMTLQPHLLPWPAPQAELGEAQVRNPASPVPSRAPSQVAGSLHPSRDTNPVPASGMSREMLGEQGQ